MTSWRARDSRLKVIAIALVPFAMVAAVWVGPQLWANRWRVAQPYAGEAAAAQSASADGRWRLRADWSEPFQLTVVVHDSVEDRWYERTVEIIDPEQFANPDGTQPVEWEGDFIMIGGQQVRLP